MKTLLVLAPHPELAESLRAGLSPEQYRIVHRVQVEEAEPLLTHGLASACIVDVEVTSVQDVWIIEKLRRRAPRVPIILFAAVKQWQWEEEAYLKGATYVLTKPVRIRMLSALLDRLWVSTATNKIPTLPPQPQFPPRIGLPNLPPHLLRLHTWARSKVSARCAASPPSSRTHSMRVPCSNNFCCNFAR